MIDLTTGTIRTLFYEQVKELTMSALDDESEG